MVSRERLVRLAGTAAELANARRVRLVAQLLLLVAIVFVLVRLRSIWHDSHVDLASVNWPSLLASCLLAAIAVASSAFIWLAILRRLGVQTQPVWAGIFLQAQLAKYIPGTIWQYAGRTALARVRGISARIVGISIAVELSGTAVAAATMTAMLLGWWGTLVVAALPLAVLGAGRYSPLSLPGGRVSVGGVARTCLLYLGVWPVLGLSFWLCARSLVPIPAADIPLYAGSFAVAWLAGFVAIYAPGGLGVREAVLVALLAGRLHTADALVVAAASRALLTLVDISLAGAGFAFLSRSGRGLSSGASIARSVDSRSQLP